MIVLLALGLLLILLVGWRVTAKAEEENAVRTENYNVTTDGTSRTDLDGAAANEIETTAEPENSAGADVGMDVGVVEVNEAQSVPRQFGKIPITIKGNSATYMYDGKEKTVTGFTVNGNPGNVFEIDGKKYTVDTKLLYVIAEGTKVGEYKTRFSGMTIVQDENGDYVSKNFDANWEPGTLTITKRNVTLTSPSESKAYDGKPLTNKNIIVGGDGFAEGEGLTYDVKGSITLPGHVYNEFQYYTTENTWPDNYTFHRVFGGLRVTDRTDDGKDKKFDITVKAKSSTVDYDGKSHSVSGFETLTFQIGDVPFTVEGLKAEASGTKPGTYEAVVTGTPIVRDAEKNDVTRQFNVHTEKGSLTIKSKGTHSVPVKSEKSISIDAHIADGNAMIADFTPETITSLIGEDGVSDVDSIGIDLSNREWAVNSIQLSKDALAVLSDTAKADNNVDKIMIQLMDAGVIVDAETLAAVVDQAEGEHVWLVVKDILESVLTPQQQEALKNYTYVKPIGAYFESGDEKIGDFKGGNVVISLAFSPEEGKDPEKYALMYLNPNGATKVYPATFKDGYLSASIDHFSEYVIIYDDGEIVPPDQNNNDQNENDQKKQDGSKQQGQDANKKIPQTADTAQPVVWQILILLAGGTILLTVRFAVKRK